MYLLYRHHLRNAVGFLECTTHAIDRTKLESHNIWPLATSNISWKQFSLSIEENTSWAKFWGQSTKTSRAILCIPQRGMSARMPVVCVWCVAVESPKLCVKMGKLPAQLSCLSHCLFILAPVYTRGGLAGLAMSNVIRKTTFKLLFHPMTHVQSVWHSW